MLIIARDPQFIIRDFLPGEEQTFINLFADEIVTRYLPKRNIAEYAELFGTALEDYAANKKLGRWGIFDADEGDFIGMCLLRVYHIDPKQIELGYSMHQKYWGMGIATAMAIAMITYCFSNIDANELVAVTTLDNIASQRVLVKAGLTKLANVIRHGEELAFFKLERAAYLSDNTDHE